MQTKFKNTLFETVSLQPWSLEYKTVFTEARLQLAEILQELQTWYASTHKLFEADSVSTSEVLVRFEKLGSLSPEHLDKLKSHASKPKDAPPPGLLNKVLNTLKKGLNRLSKATTYPPVDDAIQATISRIMAKSEDSPFKEYLKKIMRAMLKIAEKGGWVASVVLLALGITQAFLSLPFLGTSIFVFAIVAAVMRVVADLVNGKSITYALVKASTLYGAGYGAAELFKSVMPLLSAAEAATPPATIGGEEAADALSQTDAVRELPAQGSTAQGSMPQGPIPEPETMQGTASFEPQGTYQVRAGDTLGSIAQANNVTAQALYDANRDIIGSNPNRLSGTMTLTIPPATIDPANPTSVWAGWRGR